MVQAKASDYFKKIRLQAVNLSEGHRLFVLFFIGIIIGTMLINVFGTGYVDKIGIYGRYLANGEVNFSGKYIDKGDFFTYCTRRYYVQVIVLLVLNCTSKKNLFNGLICLYKGFGVSILICASTISFGSGGILLFLISIFPHYLVYVPMFIYTLYYGMNFRRYLKNHNYISGIVKGFIIESLLVVSTSFLEVYVNLPLLIKVFS